MRLASIVMNVPCSGPIWKITRSGNLSAVSAIRSPSSASGGLEWATRYSCRLGRRCSDPEAMGSRLVSRDPGRWRPPGLGKLSRRDLAHTAPAPRILGQRGVGRHGPTPDLPEDHHDGADTPAAGRDRAGDGQPDPV